MINENSTRYLFKGINTNYKSYLNSSHKSMDNLNLQQRCVPKFIQKLTSGPSCLIKFFD